MAVAEGVSGFNPVTLGVTVFRGLRGQETVAPEWQRRPERYGLVLDSAGNVDPVATEALRQQWQAFWGPAPTAADFEAAARSLASAPAGPVAEAPRGFGRIQLWPFGAPEPVPPRRREPRRRRPRRTEPERPAPRRPRPPRPPRPPRRPDVPLPRRPDIPGPVREAPRWLRWLRGPVGLFWDLLRNRPPRRFSGDPPWLPPKPPEPPSTDPCAFPIGQAPAYCSLTAEEYIYGEEPEDFDPWGEEVPEEPRAVAPRPRKMAQETPSDAAPTPSPPPARDSRPAPFPGSPRPRPRPAPVAQPPAPQPAPAARGFPWSRIVVPSLLAQSVALAQRPAPRVAPSSAASLQQPPQPAGLTAVERGRVEFDNPLEQQCRELARQRRQQQQRRRKRKRQECWKGSYIESDTGTRKRRRVRVNCTTGEELP